ncbi:type VI secretion system Vgr family protein [Sorangium sp. So ce1153]|uniref:type VI secretion system Vgr family protein n=1 Tax=Sorangium sp. So ce1153 TaxID=3133333 RepID=UPI003F5EA04B
MVAFRGAEAIASLYRYEITALAREPAPEVDPDELIQRSATLRLATLTQPSFRVVHGIVVEAEELGPVPGGMLYRLVLMPPLARAMHRTRCRIFLEKTTRQIIEAVLQDDPALRLETGGIVSPDSGDEVSFAPAREVFTWRLTDPSRVDNVATRPYCVQYNESDFAFVCRLLEEEGISYHFENGEGTCLLVLADKDAGRARLDPFAPLGPGIAGRSVAAMKLGARLRPRKVSLVDYNWKQPALDMAVVEPARPVGADLVDHEYPGRYTETPAMGKPLAAAKLDRLEVEASYAVGEGTCRALSAGSIFALEHPQPRYEGEYLATKLEVRGEQLGVLPPNAAAGLPSTGAPYAVTMECARRGKNGSVGESRYRPARVTPKPRIQGSQTAFITAEPGARGAEIHVGGPPGTEIGCVRVKFHWDQDTARHGKEPTSCWVRVNQVFAGVGEGAVFHPRVGVEVIVDYEEGDPDRPIVVGRVYNGKNRPPGGAPTVSTFKTMSSPASGAFNELTFDDTAGNEQIKMHTPYNWNSDAGNDRSEKVGNNSASSVGVDRNESTGANRSTMVGSNNSEIVGENDAITIGADQNVTIGAHQRTNVGVDQGIEVGGSQNITIGAHQTIDVGASQKTTVGAEQTLAVQGNRTVTVSGNRGETVQGNRTERVAGNGEQTIEGNKTVGVLGASDETVNGARVVTVHGTMAHTVDGDVTLTANAALTQTVAANFTVGVSGDGKIDASGKLDLLAGADGVLQGANISVNAQGEIVLSAGGSSIKISGAGVEINGATIKAAGGSVDITGGIVKIN